MFQAMMKLDTDNMFELKYITGYTRTENCKGKTGYIIIKSRRLAVFYSCCADCFVWAIGLSSPAKFKSCLVCNKC